MNFPIDFVFRCKPVYTRPRPLRFSASCGRAEKAGERLNMENVVFGIEPFNCRSFGWIFILCLIKKPLPGVFQQVLVRQSRTETKLKTQSPPDKAFGDGPGPGADESGKCPKPLQLCSSLPHSPPKPLIVPAVFQLSHVP